MDENKTKDILELLEKVLNDDIVDKITIVIKPGKK